jgi:hypothetical protein
MGFSSPGRKHRFSPTSREANWTFSFLNVDYEVLLPDKLISTKVLGPNNTAGGVFLFRLHSPPLCSSYHHCFIENVIFDLNK